MTALKPYMVYCGDPMDGAVLVFATSVREAIRIGARVIRGWFDCAYIDVRANLQRDRIDFLLTLADPDKLAVNQPHLIEQHRMCTDCESWGYPILADGICERCHGERAEIDLLESENYGQTQHLH